MARAVESEPAVLKEFTPLVNAAVVYSVEGTAIPVACESDAVGISVCAVYFAFGATFDSSNVNAAVYIF